MSPIKFSFILSTLYFNWFLSATQENEQKKKTAFLRPFPTLSPIFISPHKQPLLLHLMYRTLTNPKFLRRLPHRSLCLYNILCNLNRPFFDIIFQGKIPRTHCFYNVCGGLQLYCSCKLAHIKCCVFSLLFHQFLMVSNFFDIAIFHIKNHICITDGRQPICNHPGRHY